MFNLCKNNTKEKQIYVPQLKYNKLRSFFVSWDSRNIVVKKKKLTIHLFND